MAHLVTEHSYLQHLQRLLTWGLKVHVCMKTYDVSCSLDGIFNCNKIFFILFVIKLKCYIPCICNMEIIPVRTCKVPDICEEKPAKSTLLVSPERTDLFHSWGAALKSFVFSGWHSQHPSFTKSTSLASICHSVGCHGHFIGYSLTEGPNGCYISCSAIQETCKFLPCTLPSKTCLFDWVGKVNEIMTRYSV